MSRVSVVPLAGTPTPLTQIRTRPPKCNPWPRSEKYPPAIGIRHRRRHGGAHRGGGGGRRSARRCSSPSTGGPGAPDGGDWLAAKTSGICAEGGRGYKSEQKLVGSCHPLCSRWSGESLHGNRQITVSLWVTCGVFVVERRILWRECQKMQKVPVVVTQVYSLNITGGLGRESLRNKPTRSRKK